MMMMIRKLRDLMKGKEDEGGSIGMGVGRMTG